MKKIRFVDIAIIATYVLLGLSIFLRSIWLSFPIIVVIILISAYRAKSKKERERRDELSIRALAFGLLIPAACVQV